MIAMEVFMREKYIPAFVVLIAAAITSIINIVNKVDVLTGLKRLLIVIIIFYIVGIIAKAVIRKAFTERPKKDFSEDDQEEESDSKE
jgi:UDP-N-acetylmuramyl pentapeptide phosphotransferase/UDP-N-acetylglucosamine-1-phosphate transferase